jgi:hypothetical protein
MILLTMFITILVNCNEEEEKLMVIMIILTMFMIMMYMCRNKCTFSRNDNKKL